VFDVDKWQEILDTIAKNKLRTFLTGFSVAWGIFMLVILLGSGQGLRRGIEHNFRDDAVNSIWIRPGETSLPYQGLQPGRRIQLTSQDYDEVLRTIEGIEHHTARFYIAGAVRVTYGREHGDFEVRSVHPGHRHVENTTVTRGRYLNELDLLEFRKVAVIGDLVRQGLFGDEDPLGRSIEVNGIAFKVVGVFEDTGGEGEMQQIYLPLTTAQRTFNGGNRIQMFMVTTGDEPLERTQAMTDGIHRELAARHRFSMDDLRAVSVFNVNERFEQFTSLMDRILQFVWVVGLGTILAGVVGVSNIMMIVVRDRTKEIGIRKALGATPASIVGLVLQESVVITAFAGYVGLILGVALVEVLGRRLPASEFFRDPGVDMRVAVWATVLLVAAGTVAGLIPARRAASVRPIEALRDEG
jgi:putative ABC transport system permease protein